MRYRKSKEERRAWFYSLSEEERKAWIDQKRKKKKKGLIQSFVGVTERRSFDLKERASDVLPWE